MEEWVLRAGDIAPVLGVIEDDELVDDAFRRDLPVVALYPEAPSSQGLKRVAEEILKLKIEPTRLLPKLELARGS